MSVMENEALAEMKRLYARQYFAQSNLTPDDIITRYDSMQDGKFSYDELMEASGETAALTTARTLIGLIPEDRRATMVLLDIGSGTGRIGTELTRHGFKIIDAIEPSESMLKAAREKNVYRNLYKLFITEAETILPKGQYDAIVTCGTFLDNHLPIEALYEFIRVVKSGGFIIIATRYKYLETMSSLKDRFEPLMKSLEEKGRWKMHSRQVFPNYNLGEDGIVWIFKVL